MRMAWIPLFCTLTLLAPAWPVAAKGPAVGEAFTFELPFPSEQPWVPDQLSWPAAVLIVRAELGSVSSKGQKIKVIPRIANGSYDDVKVTVEMALLDVDGQVVAEESETDGLEESEISAFSFRLTLPVADAEKIERCRIVVTGEED